MSETVSMEKIANSASITAISRLSMLATPVMLAVIATVGVRYLDTRFELQNNIIADSVIRVGAVEMAVREAGNKIQEISTRTTAIEASRVEARIAANGRNDLVLSRLDRVESATNELSKQVATLSAKLEAFAALLPPPNFYSAPQEYRSR